MAWGTRNLRRSWRQLRGDCRGAVAIELGFALPVLILLSVGLFDVSMLIWRASTIENAASEGARFAVVNGASAASPASADEIETYIRAQAVGIPAAALAVDVTWQDNNQSGSYVRVALDYTHDFLIGGLIGLDPMTVNKTSRMIIF